MLFHHVLVAIDGSKPAAKALDTAIALVESKQAAKLTVVHVYNAPTMAVADALVSAPVSVQRQWVEEAQTVLQEAERRLSHLAYGQTVLLEGRPAEAIMDYAAQNGCNLIVIGSRGLSAIREFMLGSVSHQVTAHADIPVLVVK